MINYWGIIAPKGTPAAVVAKLNHAVDSILAQAEVRERLLREGVDILGGSPQVLGKLIAGDYRKWKKLVVDANLTFE